jgi:hypothetical protein
MGLFFLIGFTLAASASSTDLAATSEHARYLVVGEGKFRPDETVGFCGAESKVEPILNYFDQIRQSVISNRIDDFSKYYAKKISIGYRGRTYTVTRSSIVRNRRLRLSIADWKTIGDLSRSRLGSGGWRGCFLSNGKAFFAVGEDGKLGLTSFDKDRAWDHR